MSKDSAVSADVAQKGADAEKALKKQKRKELKRALLAEMQSKEQAEPTEPVAPVKKEKLSRTQRAQNKREAIARRGEKRSLISIGKEPSGNRGLLKGLVPEAVEEAENTVEEPQSTGSNERYDVFIDGVPYDWSIQDIRDLFSAAGNVLDVRAPVWQDSGRLRGYAHVTYDSLEGQQKAIKQFHMYYVTQQRFFKVTEAQAPNCKPQGAQNIPEGCKRIFVKNLPYDATESEIAGLFGGKRVTNVRIVTQYGRSKGFAYVDFKDYGGCINACELARKGNGITLRSRVLRVDYETGDARAGFHYRKEAYETRLGPKKKKTKVETEETSAEKLELF